MTVDIKSLLSLYQTDIKQVRFSVNALKDIIEKNYKCTKINVADNKVYIVFELTCLPFYKYENGDIVIDIEEAKKHTS